MRRAIATVLLLVVATAPWLVRADSSGSPLDSAQESSARGANARFEALTAGDLAARLRAIRASPFGHTPEDALVPLASIAAGRDPSLAPAAAVAAYRIANGLSRLDLEAHESDPAAITEAATAFRAIAADGTARPDVRRLAGYVASGLGSL